jgi:hypothetical protein
MHVGILAALYFNAHRGQADQKGLEDFMIVDAETHRARQTASLITSLRSAAANMPRAASRPKKKRKGR